jgi:ornithine cyclodeaminase/alanine dehydrogenase-like protein (mu-crystallin family)
MRGGTVLILTKDDIKRLVPMRQAVDLMKEAFRELSAGRAQAPLRSVLEVNNDPSAMLMMPGFVPSHGALGFKMVSFFGKNPARGLPTIHALVCLIDDENGIPLGVLEGGFVTALRTGAVSGAATDLLARQDSRTVTVIGAGVQGLTQAVAVCAVRPIERIIAVDIDADRLEAYRARMADEWPEFGGIVETSSDADAAVAEADVVCTATTARQAVFSNAAVRPGTHINAVGAFTPEMQEIPVETCGRAVIAVDNHDAVMAEAGDLLKAIEVGAISEDDLRLELGHLVEDPSRGRADNEQVTLFKSVGNSVQDVIVAKFAIDAASDQGMGQRIELF